MTAIVFLAGFYFLMTCNQETFKIIISYILSDEGTIIETVLTRISHKSFG